MKYTGRIGGVIFVFVNLILNLLFNDHNMFNIERFFIVLANLALCWWLGMKYDEAKFYSEKDPLTGVYNRRFVIKLFKKLLARVKKRKGNLSLFVIDINNFKNINDSHGHEVGDTVIFEIAKAFSKSIRKTDIVARWGGDEFLVIMPYSDDATPTNVMERVWEDLEEASEKLEVPISISIGKSVYPENADNLVELIRIADKQMYERKFAKK